MLDQGRISSVQLLLLFIISESASGFIFAPSVTAAAAGPDAWLCGLLASVYGLIVAVICLSLAKRFPSQVFTDYLPQILGKIPGKLLAAAFSLAMLYACLVTVSLSSTYVHVAFFRETPAWVIDILFVTAAVYGAALGIEVIARQGNITLPVFGTISLIMIFLVVKDLNLNNLRPLLENGVLPVLQGSGAIATWRGEIFFLLMLYPYLNRKEEATKTVVIMLVFQGLLSALIIAQTVAIFGDQLTTRIAFPIHNAVRYISAGDILQRIELYLFLTWVAIATVKLAFFLHIASIAAASTLGLKDYRRALIPIAVIAVIGSNILYDHNYLRLKELITQTGPFYSGAIELLLPALVLLVAVIAKKGGDRDGPVQKSLKHG